MQVPKALTTKTSMSLVFFATHSCSVRRTKMRAESTPTVKFHSTPYFSPVQPTQDNCVLLTASRVFSKFLCYCDQPHQSFYGSLPKAELSTMCQSSINVGAWQSASRAEQYQLTPRSRSWIYSGGLSLSWRGSRYFPAAHAASFSCHFSPMQWRCRS